VASIGSVGDAHDNAVAESFFATLQTELFDRRSRATRRQLAAIFDYVEGWDACLAGSTTTSKQRTGLVFGSRM